MNEMTIEQQRKATIFSICFLRDEIRTMENIIHETTLENKRDYFIKRLAELEEDLQTFRVLRDQFRI